MKKNSFKKISKILRSKSGNGHGQKKTRSLKGLKLRNKILSKRKIPVPTSILKKHDTMLDQLMSFGL